MEAARTRYELLVGTLMSNATLSTFRVPVRPTAVPRQTLYRFRVPANCDLPDVLDRLTEGDVQVLEIRLCVAPSRCRRGAEPAEDGVVVPFTGGDRAEARRRHQPGGPPGGGAGSHDPGDPSAG